MNHKIILHQLHVGLLAIISILYRLQFSISKPPWAWGSSGPLAPYPPLHYNHSALSLCPLHMKTLLIHCMWTSLTLTIAGCSWLGHFIRPSAGLIARYDSSLHVSTQQISKSKRGRRKRVNAHQPKDASWRGSRTCKGWTVVGLSSCRPRRHSAMYITLLNIYIDPFSK
jgi:hypothetical protein